MTIKCVCRMFSKDYVLFYLNNFELIKCIFRFLYPKGKNRNPIIKAPSIHPSILWYIFPESEAVFTDVFGFTTAVYKYKTFKGIATKYICTMHHTLTQINTQLRT